MRMIGHTVLDRNPTLASSKQAEPAAVEMLRPLNLVLPVQTESFPCSGVVR